MDRKSEHDNKEYQLVDIHPTDMPLPIKTTWILMAFTHAHKKTLNRISVIYIMERRHKYVTLLHKTKASTILRINYMKPQ